MKYKLEWHNPNTQESVGVFEYETYDFTERPPCPKCGRTADYNEAQTGDNEFTGASEYHAWFECLHCDIESESWEIDN